MPDLVIVAAILFAIARFVVPVEGAVSQPDIFKDFAHLFVGGLFGAAWRGRDWSYLYLGLGLTVLEVVAFFIRKN